MRVPVVTNHNRRSLIHKPVDSIRCFRFVYFLMVAATAVWLAGCKPAEPIDGAVVGNSMAPNLLGAHYQIHCEDCRISFLFGRQPESQPPEKIVCPNCGFTDNPFINSTEQSPESVKIFPAQSLSRWSEVAFEFPEKDIAGTKRVAGLPGETIEISRGDLYVDGEIVRKDLRTQKRMRIPVHDSYFQPTTDLPARWRRSVKEPNWLTYHHWRCCAQRGSRIEDYAVEDSYGFNQTLARNLHQTVDLFLQLDVTMQPDSEFGWRFYRGPLSYEFWISKTPRHLSIEVKNPESSELDRQQVELLPFESDHLRIEFSAFDAQAIVVVNDDLIFQQTLEPSTSPPTKYPLEISSLDSKIELHRIQIWKDIFYYAESETGRKLTAGPDEYILLGDNVPVSIDSRHWHPAGIKTNAIIGIIRENTN